MKKRYVVLALALTAALCTALPAVGASPAQLAKKAFGLAKKANKRAKSAGTRARSAQSAADAAGAAANGAQATADAARSAAGAAQSAAGAARTSARQVYRDGPQALAPSAGPVTVASMYGVAPGAYVIMAKTDVFAGGTGDGIVQCRVDADGDSDFANSRLGDGPNAVFEDTLEANTVHTFTATGAIFLRCTNNMPSTGTATAQQTKIIAIKVGGITSNTAVSG
jgi:hypothetical protein